MATNKPNIQEQLMSQATNEPKSVLEVEHHFASPVYYIDKPEFLAGVRNACDEFLALRHKEQAMDEIYPVMMTGNMYNDPRCQDLSQ